MAPEFGETQAFSHFGSHGSGTAVLDDPVEVVLPTMDDIDRLVSELDAIDATLMELG
ncbi:MAG: hypothetical protein HKN24_14880 [Acidimicrobiales bacterium]|nr:hypothetical protein [Acidimicrobiales bacterium]